MYVLTLTAKEKSTEVSNQYAHAFKFYNLCWKGGVWDTPSPLKIGLKKQAGAELGQAQVKLEVIV